MHAKPGLRVVLEWMIAGSSLVIVAVIRLTADFRNFAFFLQYHMLVDESSFNTSLLPRKSPERTKLLDRSC